MQSGHMFCKAKTAFSHVLCPRKSMTIGEYFYAQLMSRAVHHDVIYHPFPVSSQ